MRKDMECSKDKIKLKYIFENIIGAHMELAHVHKYTTN